MLQFGRAGRHQVDILLNPADFPCHRGPAHVLPQEFEEGDVDVFFVGRCLGEIMRPRYVDD